MTGDEATLHAVLGELQSVADALDYLHDRSEVWATPVQHELAELARRLGNVRLVVARIRGANAPENRQFDLLLYGCQGLTGTRENT